MWRKREVAIFMVMNEGVLFCFFPYLQSGSFLNINHFSDS